MKFVKMLEAVPAPGHIHLYWLGQAGFLIKNSIGKGKCIGCGVAVVGPDGFYRETVLLHLVADLHSGDLCWVKARFHTDTVRSLAAVQMS